MVQIPSFPEANHPLIQTLNHYSDLDLLTLFQRYPEQGKYFTGIFCRYSPIIYSLVGNSARSPVQADYIFALTWRHIFHELRGLNLRDEHVNADSLQNWLINTTAMCLNGTAIPPVESINYDIKQATPPLWCYLEQALELIPPLVRLILVMADNYHWSPTRISAYLQAEGESLTSEDVEYWMEQGRQFVLNELPKDICELYFPEALGSREDLLDAV
jgi:hypothetical protein